MAASPVTFRSAVRTLFPIVLVAAGLFVASPRPRSEAAFTWRLPAGFPPPRVPDDNPITAAKVALGRRLFYDVRLSANGQQSCAGCHQQDRAFTDGRARAIGSTGALHRRSSMSLANAGYAARLSWADSSLTSLEAQATIPIFNEQPVELGMPKDGVLLLTRLRADTEYRRTFADAFPGDNAITVRNVTRALASFERALISASSPYDRYRAGRDESALSAEAKRGLRLFSSQQLNCARCHRGFTLSGAAEFDGRRQQPPEYFDIGLSGRLRQTRRPTEDLGLFDRTGEPDDVGKFKAPTLRNIAVTAPYMHDGSIETLSEILDYYAAGSRTNAFLRGFTLSSEDRRDILAFLDSLTDQTFLHDPTFAEPEQP